MISPPEQSPNDKATTSKKKRIVDKSEVWKHFVKTNIDGIDYDICNVHNEDENKVCGKKYKHSQSTSALRRHLLNKHSSLGKIKKK